MALVLQYYFTSIVSLNSSQFLREVEEFRRIFLGEARIESAFLSTPGAISGPPRAVDEGRLGFRAWGFRDASKAPRICYKIL